MTAAAIIVAAGRGRRALDGADTTPKQFRQIAGKAVLARTVAAFCRHTAIQTVIVVIHPDDEELARQTLGEPDGRLSFVVGGSTRQQSVAAGLLALAAASPTYVLIHDAARPFVSDALIARTLEALTHHDAILPAVPLADTIKRAASGIVTETVDRTGLFAAQTPQAFAYALIADLHARAARDGRSDFTDDVALVEWAGRDVHLVEGDPANCKLTTPRDFNEAELRLRGEAAMQEETRTGFGFDVHEFGDGDAVILCGVSIPHERALKGHSDADVGLHALTDALLGAICDGDIGTHFPPSDTQWRGASSDRFLRHAAERVRTEGGRILHADVTLLCEAPKIGPHRDAMRAQMADILQISKDRVAVKATTMEGLGFIGRREGIAAQATATIALPARHDDV